MELVRWWVAATRPMLPPDEKCVAGENSAVMAIFEQEADAVLSVARRVQGFHFDVLTDGEGLAVAGSLGDLVTVLAADNGKGVALEKFDVAAGVVVMTDYWLDWVIVRVTRCDILVSIDDVRQLDAAIRCFLQVR